MNLNKILFHIIIIIPYKSFKYLIINLLISILVEFLQISNYNKKNILFNKM